MKMKKILAMLLSAAMCVSAFSVAAFAEEAEEATDVTALEAVEEIAEEAVVEEAAQEAEEAVEEAAEEVTEEAVEETAEIEKAEEVAEEAVAELAAEEKEEEKEEAQAELSAEGDSEQEPQENYVAKVGNTSYTSIDDAIANWTNNQTLTLLDNVTLSDVIQLSSTEKHILDLGTYTMTAASGKDAIQIVNNGRSSASYALDIKADAENPGGITATGKAIVRTSGKSGVKDRPIIRFYGGVFNASNIAYHSGSNGTNCPQFYFYGGEFNGTVYTNRTLNQFHGGTFNGSLMMSVDSSAYALISGGTFKQLSNLYMSALNSDKFTIGSAKGKFDREVYINKDGYYVVAATLPEGGIEAIIPKNPGTNDYLKYSKVATEGVLKYEEADVALKNNSSSGIIYLHASSDADITVSGTLTLILDSGTTTYGTDATEGVVYSGDVTLSKSTATFTVQADANSKFTGDVKAASGYVVKSTPNPDGTVTYSNVAPVAKIGDTGYATLGEAIKEAEDGDTITLMKDITSEKITVSGKELTIDLADNTLTITTQNNFNTDADVTFKNGDICITGAVSGADALFCVGNYSTNATVTLENVDVYGDGYNSAYAVFYVYNDSELNINGGSVKLSNEQHASGGVFKAEQGADGEINITGTEENPVELAFTNAKIGFLDGTVVMDYVDLDIIGGANAINQSALTVKNSDLTITGCDGRALTLSQGDVIIENSNLNFSDCSEGEIRFKKSLELTADENSTISLCSAYADASATGATINGEPVINNENKPDFVVVDDEKSIVANGDITYGCYNVGTTGEAGTDSYRERIQVDIYNAKAKESLVVKLYSGETLLSETSRRAADRDDENAVLFPVNGTTTAAIIISGKLSGSWETDWKVKPSAALIPDKIELYADGILVDNFAPAFDDEDTAAYKALSGVSSGEISYAGQVITRGTPDDENFRERVGVGLKNLKAKNEVKVELYSGNTLLSTTTLRETDRDDENKKLFPAVGKDEFTVNIVVCGEQSGSWDTEWKVAPSVVYIPDSIKLYVDGILTDELDKGFLDGNEEKYIALTGVYAPVKIGEAKYPTIEAAVAAAVDGDTITVIEENITGTSVTIKNDITLDLGGNTLTDAYIIVTGEVEITNGYIVNINEPYPLVVQNGGELDITDVEIRASKSDRAVWVKDNSTLNLNAGADIIATKGEGNTITNLIAGVYTSTNTTVNVNGGTITVDTPDNKAVGIYGNYKNADVNMTAGKISTSGKNYSYGINVDGDITISDGEIVTNEKKYTTGNTKGITNGYNYALVTALGDVTVTGGKITTNGYSGYMVNVGRSYNSNDQTVTITDVEFRNNLSEIDKTVGGHKAPVLIWEGSASTVTASITGGDFYGVSENLLREDGDAVLSVSGGIFETKPEEKYLADSYTTVKLADGRYAVLAKDYSPTEIAVVFEYVPEKETEEEIVYNINLEAAGEVINRLNSGDLTFVLTQTNQGENNKYEIIDIAGDNIAVNPVDDKGRYEFHFSTKTNVENDTATSITIAQVKFTGYGTFSFGVDANANATNAVHTTTIVDNIVDTFIPDGDGEEYGKLSIGTGIEDTIAVPKRTLEIGIEFPNAVEDKEYEYQQMTVVVSGGDLDENITFNLGTGDDAVAMNAATGAYEIVLKDTLTKNIRYNVTVSGAGYRTAYYTVQMTENKALKFWNNVKDAGKVIEYTYGEDGALVAKENADKPLTTFLAGDIVNDGLINIYDLSAVVSYFGEIDLVEDNKYEYAKYDLNRDGLIDSKDVAYVLVSWNN